MKKRKKRHFLLSVSLLISLSLSPIQSFTESDIQFQLNGKILPLPTKILLENGRILLPYAAIGEYLDAKSSWDPASRRVTLTKENQKIILKIGSTEAVVNGKTVLMDTPPIIQDDRTMVPLRFIAETLSCTIDWDNKERMVSLHTTTSASVSEINFELIDNPASYPFLKKAMDSLNREQAFTHVIHHEGYSYVILNYGQRRSGGYHAEIKKVSLMSDHSIFVDAKLNSPPPNAIVTMAITYPHLILRFENKDGLPIRSNLPVNQQSFY